MKSLSQFLLWILVFVAALPVEAKKYKWTYNDHQYEVYTTGQGKNRTQLVKAWAVGKNADKAIENAMMDAVSAALFTGIEPDESTHGMGVSNLRPLVNDTKYSENASLFQDFFKKGEFMNYVRQVNSTYPSGENNVAVPGGRRVCIRLVINYPGLRSWLIEKGILKDLGKHFKD